MSRNAAEPLGKPSGIAVVATCTDLRAPSDRVPRRVGPLDRAVLRHDYPQIRAESLHVIFSKEKRPEILSRPSFPRITAFSLSDGDVARTSVHNEVGGLSLHPKTQINSSRDGDGCSIL